MIKIGIVGAGIIGKTHKNAIVNNENCTLAAICDLVEESAGGLADGTNANIYTDYKAMAESEQLDAVVLNLPHFLHKDVSIYFLEKGVATLVEKPMALSAAECDEMIAVAKKTGTPFAVGHVQRYYKAHKYLRNIIKNNELGKLCAISETRNVSYFPNRPKWFLNKEQSGGGILMNYGAHTIDKLLYVTGQKIKSVHAIGSNFLNDDNIEATAQLLIELSDGSSVNCTYCGCDAPYQYTTFYYFTNGTVRIDDCEKMLITKGKDDTTEIKFDIPKLIDYQLVEFVKMLNGEENEMVTPEYGREVMAVLDKAYSQI